MRKLVLAAASLAVLGMPAHAAPVFDRFTSFYAIGDSLSYDGRYGELFELPSVGSRYSNGPVWVEYIAGHFATDFNFAVGGATAGPVNANLYPAPLVPLSTSAGQGQAVAASAGASGTNPLVSVLFGANDLFQGLASGSLTPAAVRGIAQNVAETIRRIQAEGGSQFDDFIVSNLPDLGAIPAFNLPVLFARNEVQRLIAAGATQAEIDGAKASLEAALQAQAAASALTLIFNDALAQELDALAALASIYRINQFLYSQELQNNPARLGLINTTFPCTRDLRAAPAAGDCIVTGINPANGQPIVLPALADGFLFVDPVHPNRIVQEDFAEFTENEVARQMAPVPLPAGFTLLIAGLGGLLVAARRRQA